MDLVVGEYHEYAGKLNYIENTGTSTAPVFMQRIGSANPLDGIGVDITSAPALADLDGDGDRVSARIFRERGRFEGLHAGERWKLCRSSGHVQTG